MFDKHWLNYQGEQSGSWLSEMNEFVMKALGCDRSVALD